MATLTFLKPILLTTALGTLLLAGCAQKGVAKAAPTSDAGRVSYGLGYNTVESLAGQLEGISMAKPSPRGWPTPWPGGPSRWTRQA